MGVPSKANFPLLKGRRESGDASEREAGQAGLLAADSLTETLSASPMGTGWGEAMGSPEDDLIGIPFPEHSSELLGRLNEQRRRGMLCDVTLRAQGSEYQSHRAVLAASSRYFQRLFAGPCMPVCELDFVGADALGALLDFAYTATLTISTGSLCDVLRAARILEIPCVIAACVEILQGNGLEAPVPDDAARERARRYLEAFGTLPNMEGDLAEPSACPAPRRSKKTRKFLQAKGSRLNNHITEVSPSLSPASTETQERPSPPSQASPAPALGHPREEEEEVMPPSRTFPFPYVPSLSLEDLGSDDEPTEQDILSYMRRLNQEGLSVGLDPPDKLVRKRRSQMPQECPVCHKIIHGAGKLPRHMRTHTGEKPFACDVCGVRFTRNDKLKIHMRKHTGERPYSCPHCTARFLHSYDLKNHLHLHTGARPYECCLCHKAFAKDDHLQRHLKGQNCLEIRTRRRRRGPDPEPDSLIPTGVALSTTQLGLANGRMEELHNYWPAGAAVRSPAPKEEEEEEEEEGADEGPKKDGPVAAVETA